MRPISLYLLICVALATGVAVEEVGRGEGQRVGGIGSAIAPTLSAPSPPFLNRPRSSFNLSELPIFSKRSQVKLESPLISLRAPELDFHLLTTTTTDTMGIRTSVNNILGQALMFIVLGFLCKSVYTFLFV